MIPVLAHFAIRQFGKLFRLPGVHRGVSDGHDNELQMRLCLIGFLMEDHFQRQVSLNDCFRH